MTDTPTSPTTSAGIGPGRRSVLNELVRDSE